MGGSNDDYASAAQQTSDGGTIVMGFTNSYGAGSYDLLLSKWAADGSVTWVKTLGGASYDYGQAVQQTSDGGYIVTGYTQSFGAGNYDLWLSKWAADGSVTWVQTLGGTSSDYGLAVQQISDGGYIVTGYTQSFSGVGKDELWLSRWAADGSLIWVKTLHGNNQYAIYREYYGRAVQQTSDGGYIVTGFNANYNVAGNTDLLLSKWAADGSLTWVQTLVGTYSDYGLAVQQTSDGGYIVTGYTGSFGAGSTDLWLSKWAADGSLTWVQTLGGASDDYGNTVQQTSDGGYIVMGYTQSFGSGGYDLWLSKWAADGSLTWVKTLGGASDDYGNTVQQTSDGGYIVTGTTNSFGAGSNDLLLSKWNSQGIIDGVDCLSQPSVTNATLTVSATTRTPTAGTPTVSAQSITLSAQAVSPSVLTACIPSPSSSPSITPSITPTATASSSVTPSISSSMVPTPSVTSSPSASRAATHSTGGGKPPWPIIGGTIGGVAACCLLGGTAAFWYRSRRRQEAQTESQELDVANTSQASTVSQRL